MLSTKHGRRREGTRSAVNSAELRSTGLLAAWQLGLALREIAREPSTTKSGSCDCSAAPQCRLHRSRDDTAKPTQDVKSLTFSLHDARRSVKLTPRPGCVAAVLATDHCRPASSCNLHVSCLIPIIESPTTIEPMQVGSLLTSKVCRTRTLSDHSGDTKVLKEGRQTD